MSDEVKVNKPIYKKWWFWAIIVIIVLGVVASSQSNNVGIQNATYKSNQTHTTKKNGIEVVVADFSSMQREEVQEWFDTNKINGTISEEYSNTVSKGEFISQSLNANTIVYQGDRIKVIYSLGKEPTTEQKNALKQAESYSKTLHMSKQGIYDQLTSQYGGQFDSDAAQYAIDNIQADWKANALAQAKSYQSNLHMSKKAVYDQLISQYGGQFTKEEAQYAIDHLDD